MNEFNQQNQNQNQNENIQPKAAPQQNSYSSMRTNDGMQQQYYSYTNPQQNPAATEPKKKKHHILPIFAGVTAGVLLVSYASIQCYRFANTNDTLRAFFNPGEQQSEQEISDPESSQNPVSAATPTANDQEYTGDSWLTVLERGNSLTTTQIVAKSMPSVVGVSATYTWEETYSSGWFGGVQQQEQSAVGTGTGIIMSEDGYIITNAHVIYDSNYGGKASEVSVVLSDAAGLDETEYKATIIGYDVESDLAVLKIQAKGLKPAEFGDSNQLQVGELAIAIGNPLGFELFGSVTCGIVSALNREVTINDNTMNLIQTDAAINSGNSGGPLINGSGQVIGINSAKLSSSYSTTTIEGLGFAIPITEAQKIINDLINYGYVTGKPQIGITTLDVSETQSSMYRIPMGVYIAEVTEGGAGDMAGLKKGDVIIAINGTTVQTANELNHIKDQFNVGDTVTLTVTRSDTDLDIDVVLQEKRPTMDE